VNAMSVKFAFHAAEGSVVAFSIDNQLFFVDFVPVIKMYDGDMKPLMVSNFDTWLQARTHQRYSLQSFQDAADAFRSGLAKTYSIGDLKDIAITSALAAKKSIMTMMGEYRKHFWVELLDPTKLDTDLASEIRDRFDEMRQRLGDDNFYNYLCRLWKLAINNRPKTAAIYERFIQRLGKEPSEPILPSTSSLDDELQKAVLPAVLTKVLGAYKGVPPHVQERVEIINGKHA
jgi:hypothetical protein